MIYDKTITMSEIEELRIEIRSLKKKLSTMDQKLAKLRYEYKLENNKGRKARAEKLDQEIKHMVLQKKGLLKEEKKKEKPLNNFFLKTVFGRQKSTYYFLWKFDKIWPLLK